jgi:hypothetical protein
LAFPAIASLRDADENKKGGAGESAALPGVVVVS